MQKNKKVCVCVYIYTCEIYNTKIYHKILRESRIALKVLKITKYNNNTQKYTRILKNTRNTQKWKKHITYIANYNKI